MNCLWEFTAVIWMTLRNTLVWSSDSNEARHAEETLLLCRNDMHVKIQELECSLKNIEKEILKCKATKQFAILKLKMQERKRYLARIDKMNKGLLLIVQQIDTLQNSELDNTLLTTLKQSNRIMKKSGKQFDVSEVGRLMNEMDERIHESNELGQVLSTPLHPNDMFDISEEEEEEEELDETTKVQLAEIEASVAVKQDRQRPVPVPA